jgi:hypothetical protein
MSKDKTMLIDVGDEAGHLVKLWVHPDRQTVEARVQARQSTEQLEDYALAIKLAVERVMHRRAGRYPYAGFEIEISKTEVGQWRWELFDVGKAECWMGGFGHETAEDAQLYAEHQAREHRTMNHF